jgi:hypothetical protein
MFPLTYDNDIVAAHHRDLREEAEARRLAGQTRTRRPRLGRRPSAQRTRPAGVERSAGV